MMNETFEIREECVDLHIQSGDQDGVLRHLVGLLAAQGYADPAYADKILEREASYPTGIQFESIAIALPHGEPEHVKHSAIAIGRCEGPLYFHSMEDPKEKLKVQLVVLLAVQNPETHLTVLNNLMQMFISPETSRQIMAADEKELCEIFKNNLYKDEEENL